MPEKPEVDPYLMVSRRGIVHVTESLEDNAATACGKGSRDFVFIGGIGPGERMCSVCRLRTRSGSTTPEATP